MTQKLQRQYQRTQCVASSNTAFTKCIANNGKSVDC